VISANSLTLDSQNTLLKLFEEPIENTHFFLIVPDINILLKTLISRFYLIRSNERNDTDLRSAEKFIRMATKDRLEYIKELLAEVEEEDGEGNEIVVLNSTRSKALKFLNYLEASLHNELLKVATAEKSSALQNFLGFFPHLFKVREFLRMPGSSAKSLMESVALMVPVL
jgi:DNA polymerase III delta prime subunit